MKTTCNGRAFLSLVKVEAGIFPKLHSLPNRASFFISELTHMQLDTVKNLEKALYPYVSHHQQEVEKYFGQNLTREITAREQKKLGEIDVFFIAFTNRSGSTLLAELLNQAGLGIPPRAEVFNVDSMLPECNKREIPSLTDYFMRTVLGWSDEGKAGFKIGGRQLFWLQRLGLLSHFRSVKLIFCTRRDKVAQAVSLHIARHTGQWHSRMSAQSSSESIEYSREAILGCLKQIHEDQTLIRYFSDIHNIPLVEVEYEQVLESPEIELRRLVDYLGHRSVSENVADLNAVTIKQQRNEDNDRLVAQFREEFSQHTSLAY